MILHYIQSVSRSLIPWITKIISFDVHKLESDINPEIKARRRIFEIIDAVQSNNPEIFRIKPAFDGKKNIFSFKPLFPGGDEGVFAYRPEGAFTEYTVTIRLVAAVDSGYRSLTTNQCLLLMPCFSSVRKLIGGSPSEAAINVSNILQVFISQHSNM